MIGTYRIRRRKNSSMGVLKERLTRVPISPGGQLRIINIRGRYQYLSDNGTNLIVSGGRSNLIFTMPRGSKIFSRDSNFGGNTRVLWVGHSPLDLPPGSSGLTISGSLSRGDPSVTTSSGTATEEWYFLRDTAVAEKNAGGGEPRPVGGELVYVTSVSGSTATLRDPIAQPYPASATLKLTTMPVGVSVCEDIRFRNFVIESAPHPIGIQALVYATYCAGIDFQRCKFAGGDSSAVHVFYSRNFTMSNCSSAKCGDLTSRTTRLNSFCFCAERTVVIQIKNTNQVDTQYGISFAAGCADFLVESLNSIDNYAGCFDLHGGGTYLGTARYVYGPDSQIQIGNIGWTLSCREITVVDSYCGLITA